RRAKPPGTDRAGASRDDPAGNDEVLTAAEADTRIVCDEADHVVELGPAPADAASFDAPMGVYLIDKSLLLAELDRLVEIEARTGGSVDSPPGAGADLASHLLTPLLGAHRICAYRFGGERGRVTPDRYWSDLGSTDAYFRANMALLESDPPLDLYQPDWNILTYQGQYPPARTVPGPTSGTEGIFVNSMLAAGTVITGGGVSHSVLFPQVRVDDGAIVDEAILFEGVRVGAGAQLRRCICDKDVSIPPGTRIGFDRREDEERFPVSPGGIVVIAKGQGV
ncbi:MAG: hypothetical protein PVH47_05060, partial [Thiohalocapsa sp.]